MVKAVDSKSTGLCPRGFESHRCRSFELMKEFESTPLTVNTSNEWSRQDLGKFGRLETRATVELGLKSLKIILLTFQNAVASCDIKWYRLFGLVV